jgi:predicted regulator of Ras-like GTPase activity (Roadblock/LC7/MglB family)
MILLTAIVGVSAAVLLLSAGYLLGAKRGFEAREQLQFLNLLQSQQNSQQTEELQRLREQLLQRQQNDTDIQSLRTELGKVQQVMTPLIQRLTWQQQHDTDIQSLRTELDKVQQVVTPLIQRERLSFALANLETGAGRYRNLMDLVNQIAVKGSFSAVLLNDAEGLPLAASSNAKDLDRLAALSSMVLLLAERISRDDAPSPLAVMIHDESNKLTLCRIFRVGGRRLMLTAVSSDAQLLPTSLDPALVKLDTVLLSA